MQDHKEFLVQEKAYVEPEVESYGREILDWNEQPMTQASTYYKVSEDFLIDMLEMLGQLPTAYNVWPIYSDIHQILNQH